jgi:O-antigen ligase
VVAGSSLLAGLIAGWLVASGRGAAVVGLAVVLLPVLLWKRPELGPAVVVGAALTIEQFPTDVGPGWATTTAGVPLFHGLDALHLAPADFLLTVLLLIAFRRGAVRSRAPVPRTATSFAFLALLSAVLLAIGLGLAHHGASRVAFMEARPYVYLAATYLLASVLVTTWSAVRAVLWAFVLGSGFKAAQGLYLFLSVRHLDPRPEAVLGHEEALFFGLFIFLTLALWLFQISGRLRLVATCLLPIVVAGDLANTRRSAWLILGGGLITLAVVGYTVLPARRRFIGRLVIVSALGLAIYLPAFWNKSGGLAQPARAVHSIVAPNARDAASDLYRIQEDANLKVNIRNAGPLGKGFGVPIDYVLPIEDISDLDPFIAYIPHDGVLYVLMRMGVLGGIAFWALLATGIIGACRLARSVDRDLAVVGALTACALVAYTMMGAVDQGFFFYRIAFVIGSLLGLAEAARRLDRTPRPVVVEPAPEPLPDVEAASQSRLRDRLSSWI